MSKIYSTFAALQEAIKQARSDAKADARRDCDKGFLKSRGVWMITTNNKEGLVAPNSESIWFGETVTARKFDGLIARVEAHFPHVDEIRFDGGWDHAETMADFDGNYTPWVAEWSVLAWRRPIARSIDQLVAMHSGFTSLVDLVEGAHISYRPSLATHHRNCDDQERAELTLIADAYDAAQAARGDGRRAYRY